MSPASDAMAQASARVAQLQSLLGLTPAAPLGGSGSSAATGTTSSTSFADALTEALGGTGSTGSTGATGATGSAASTDSLAAGRQAVALAAGYSGVPYRWGGTDPAKGLDCSGLVQLVYGKLGVDLPRVAADQAKAGTKVASIARAQPGDLVFFGSPAHHVGIYAGDGMMIDAPRTGSTVGRHAIAGYGTVSEIRRVSGSVAAGATPDGTAGTALASGASGGTARASVLNLAATELLSATGLSGLSRATGSSGTAGASALGGPYAGLFTAAGNRYGVDPALLSAVARTESSYDASAVSPAGARGLMQLMPGTARSLGVNPDDPAQAVDGGARLLSDLLGQFDGKTDLALAAYNAGPGAVRRHGGVPPYPETRTYVERVTRAWEALR